MAKKNNPKWLTEDALTELLPEELQDEFVEMDFGTRGPWSGSDYEFAMNQVNEFFKENNVKLEILDCGANQDKDAERSPRAWSSGS